MFNDTDRTWQYFGEHDPYYGVWSTDQFRRDNLDATARQAFFQSGEAHIDRLARLLDQQFGATFQRRRALDFGCGVGRLVVPLARRYPQVVGVDVSEAMLREGERNCREWGLTGAEFVLGDDQLSRVTGTFEFVHSFNVFQHIPVRRGEAITRQLLDRLADGGFGALHFTYRREMPARIRLAYWLAHHAPLVRGLLNVLVLKRAFREPLMQMNEYSLNRLYALLQEAGAHRIVAEFSRHPSPYYAVSGVFLLFQKKPRPLW